MSPSAVWRSLMREAPLLRPPTLDLVVVWRDYCPSPDARRSVRMADPTRAQFEEPGFNVDRFGRRWTAT
jgi:hypothetical protein